MDDSLRTALEHGFTEEQYRAAKRLEYQIFGPYQWQNQGDRAAHMVVQACVLLAEAEKRGRVAGLREAADNIRLRYYPHDGERIQGAFDRIEARAAELESTKGE